MQGPLFIFFAYLIIVVFANDDNDNEYQTMNLGKCRIDEDCEKNGWSNQQCVSVNTNRVGLKELSQCSLKPACAGMQPGYCPSFQYWSDLRYRQVQPICVLLEPKNCRGIMQTNEPTTDEDSTMTISSSSSKVVDCQTINVNGNVKHVIYGCQDVETYQATSFYPQSIVNAQINGCIGNNTDGLCNGCGTCIPSDFTNISSYGCQCFEGFSGTYCENVVNGSCQADNQCGPGRCDQKTKQCICQNGYTGKKCELCSTGEDACFGNGKCNNGVCECSSGFTGKFCQNDRQGIPVPVNASKFDHESTSSGNIIALGSALSFLPFMIIYIFNFHMN